MSFNNKRKAAETAVNDECRVFVYIGPSVKGLITNGSIHTGTRKQVLAKLKPAIDKYPKIERLIIADKEVAKAREKINKGGNGLSMAYRSLLSAEKEDSNA